MAFGFLKKLAALVAGKKKPSAQKGRPGAAAQKKDGAGQGGNGRGKRGRRGRRGGEKVQQEGGGRQQKDGAQARPERKAPNGASAPKRGGERRRDEPRGARRSERGAREERRRDGSRRGPKSVNTAANEMRPGGVVSAEEMEARKAAHAAWHPASFVVPEMEGKKRFQDFDLPAEVLHGIADLGFQYCTEIQALSL